MGGPNTARRLPASFHLYDDRSASLLRLRRAAPGCAQGLRASGSAAQDIIGRGSHFRGNSHRPRTVSMLPAMMSSERRYTEPAQEQYHCPVCTKLLSIHECERPGHVMEGCKYVEVSFHIVSGEQARILTHVCIMTVCSATTSTPPTSVGRSVFFGSQSRLSPRMGAQTLCALSRTLRRRRGALAR